MENTSALDVKYNKLATGYSKLRGQVTVLKQALLEEQGKSSTLRETLRQKDTALRRAEQEVDSLGFRNKQLEHRVASLQDDFNREVAAWKSSKGGTRGNKPNSDASIATNSTAINDSVNLLFTEDLQKKIIENAQLTSLIADKDADIELYRTRIAELEHQLQKRSVEQTELERKLRKDIESLSARNATLESKLTESVSIVGSEDALSCSENDHILVHRTTSSSEERIAQLEKDLFHWKTKYDILKMSGNQADSIMVGSTLNGIVTQQQQQLNGPISRNSGPSVTSSDHKTTDAGCVEKLSNEQLIQDHFMKKLDAVFAEKCLAESKVASYIIECDSLFHNLELITNELENRDKVYSESQRGWQQCEEDLATTRINYEEQISVLTEQVISLSDQLAALK